MAGVDFKVQLKKQIGFIERSCVAYDAGERDEAVRIATALRVIFHQTNRSTSLMTHLQVRNLVLMSSLPPERKPSKGTVVYAASLVKSEYSSSLSLGGKAGEKVVPLGISPEQLQTIFMASMKAEATFSPQLSDLPMLPVPFAKWWAEEVVVVAGGFGFTREGLVLVASNKDGGAHVDSSLPDGYECLLAGSPIVMTVKKSVGAGSAQMADEYKVHPSDMHHATLRQLAFEVLNSPEIRRLL